MKLIFFFFFFTHMNQTVHFEWTKWLQRSIRDNLYDLDEPQPGFILNNLHVFSSCFNLRTKTSLFLFYN